MLARLSLHDCTAYFPSPTAFRLRLCCCCCSVLSLSPHSKSHDTNTIHGLSSWNRSAQTFTCNIKEKLSISDLPLCCSRLVYWPADPQTIITNHGLLNLLSRPQTRQSLAHARTAPNQRTLPTKKKCSPRPIPSNMLLCVRILDRLWAVFIM